MEDNSRHISILAIFPFCFSPFLHKFLVQLGHLREKEREMKMANGCVCICVCVYIYTRQGFDLGWIERERRVQEKGSRQIHGWLLFACSFAVVEKSPLHGCRWRITLGDISELQLQKYPLGIFGFNSMNRVVNLIFILNLNLLLLSYF